MQRGPRWFQSEVGPRAHEAGSPVVPKQRRAPRPCGRGLGGPKTGEAPSTMR